MSCDPGSAIPETTSVQVSVVLPAYNEGAHLYGNLLRLCEALRGIEHELIVVDDGSTDDTAAQVRRAGASDARIRLRRLETNRGKGAALVHGVADARGQWVVFLDADLEIPGEYVPQALAMAERHGADVVIAVKDASGFPYFRRILSSVYRWCISSLFGLSVSDTQTGLKVFRKGILDTAVQWLAVRHFAFDLELIVIVERLGSRIVELPVEVTFRRSGPMGRFRPWHLLGMALDTVSIYYRASFWTWLRPGLAAKLWMLMFVAGVFVFGIGLGKLITPMALDPPFSSLFYVLALQFLPAVQRDILLVVGGGLAIALAAIQINKILLKAFARHDRGDLAGIVDRCRK